MAPKTKFTKEQIIEAAFDIARKDGMESITIRAVADKLGSSIAPIYVNFKNVDELKQAITQKTLDISNQLVQEQHTGNAFRDIGRASLLFAREYPVLFRELAMQENDYDETIGNHLVEQMKTDPDLHGFNNEELANILLKMRIFQTGLSIMVANNQLSPDFTDEQMIQLLESAAYDVIASAHLRKGNMK